MRPWCKGDQVFHSLSIEIAQGVMSQAVPDSQTLIFGIPDALIKMLTLRKST